MPDLLRAASGQQVQTSSESGPSSYPTGGFSIRTGLGRVDEALVQNGNASYEARLDSISDNNAIVVTMYSQGTGTELAAGTDLSDDSVTYQAKRL